MSGVDTEHTGEHIHTKYDIHFLTNVRPACPKPIRYNKDFTFLSVGPVGVFCVFVPIIKAKPANVNSADSALGERVGSLGPLEPRLLLGGGGSVI